MIPFCDLKYKYVEFHVFVALSASFPWTLRIQVLRSVIEDFEAMFW